MSERAGSSPPRLSPPAPVVAHDAVLGELGRDRVEAQAGIQHAVHEHHRRDTRPRRTGITGFTFDSFTFNDVQRGGFHEGGSLRARRAPDDSRARGNVRPIRGTPTKGDAVHRH